MSTTVTIVKKDAVISVQLGAGIIQKFQQILTSMVAEHSTEELALLNQLITEKNTDFPEEWMDQVFFLTQFIGAIEAEAVKQGQTVQQDIASSTEDN